MRLWQRCTLKSMIVQLSVLLLGFALAACGGSKSKPGDPCDPNPCLTDHKTQCTDEAGQAVCACDPGYRDDGTGACAAYDPCLEDSTCADQSRACTASGDQAVCGDCLDGFHEDVEGACVADQTCQEGSCHGHGACDVSTGVVVCICEDGYAGDYCERCAAGYHDDGTGACVLDQQCLATSCNANGSCDDSGGVVVCTCDAGYTGDHCDGCDSGYHFDTNGNCSVNEICADGDPCGSNGTCDDTSGLIECVCNAGYTGDLCESCAAGYHDDGTGACVFDEQCPPTPTPIALSQSYFYGDATAPRSVSAWGIASYPVAIPKSTRSTVFWGRFQNNACANPGYGLNVEHPLSVPGIQVCQAFYPDCASNYGPSVDADVYAHQVPQHLLRTEVRPNGAFTSFGPSGQNASGANAYIQATYTAFNPPWQSNIANRLRPWGGPSTAPDQIRFALSIEESVTQALLEDPNNQQLQQVLWMNVINEACDIASSSSFCQIQFNLKTYNRGVGAYTTFDEGSAFNDGGQGGLIAVIGPIAAIGQSTSVSGASAWTSWGSSTQIVPFQDKRFQVEMSWTQFQTLLLNVTNNNPAAVFGANWQDRNSWVLLNVGYGQENYNRSNTAASKIEGLFEKVEIYAL